MTRVGHGVAQRHQPLPVTMHIKFLATLIYLPALTLAATYTIGEITPPLPVGWRVEQSSNEDGPRSVRLKACHESEGRELDINLYPNKDLLGISGIRLVALASGSDALLGSQGYDLETFRLSKVDAIYFVANNAWRMRGASGEYIRSFIETRQVPEGCSQVYKIPIIKSQVVESDIKPEGRFITEHGFLFTDNGESLHLKCTPVIFKTNQITGERSREVVLVSEAKTKVEAGNQVGRDQRARRERERATTTTSTGHKDLHSEPEAKCKDGSQTERKLSTGRTRRKAITTKKVTKHKKKPNSKATTTNNSDDQKSKRVSKRKRKRQSTDKGTGERKKKRRTEK